MTLLPPSSKQRLVSNLRLLFPEEKLPGRFQAVLSFEGDDDTKDLAALLGNKKWSEITYLDFKRKYAGPVSEAFCYLTDEGKRYYMPTFISMVVANRVETDDLPEVMLYVLYKDASERGTLLSKFSSPQIEAIISFFETTLDQNKTLTVRLSKLRDFVKSRKTVSC
jgi:hypothetical protein